MNTFVEIFNEKQLPYQSIPLSTFVNAEDPFNDEIRVAIIFQDLDESDLLTNIDKITNRVLYPLWFRGVSIVFISKLEWRFRKELSTGLRLSSLGWAIRTSLFVIAVMQKFNRHFLRSWHDKEVEWQK